MSSSRPPSPVPSSAPEEHQCPALDQEAQWDDHDALRGEIYVADRLVSHAAELARCHGVPSRFVVSGRLWPRFLAVRDQIHAAYRVLTARVRANHDPSPAEEWLLDNSHVVEDQIREIKEDLPRGYLLELRRLSTGRMRGYPRVYALCLDYLRHTDARLDFGTLSDYVLAYQREQPLTIGELWAIPIMLRLGLLLTVGSLAAAEANAGVRERADAWATRLLSSRTSARSLRAELAELEEELPSNVAAFLVHLERRLREHDDPALALASDWIANRSAQLGKTLEDLIRLQHLKQAADQVSVGNAITSMRSVAALDWNDFFERTSEVEALLRQDPLGAYTKTNSATRDRYRHAVEALARRASSTEAEVAAAALEMARNSRASEPRSRHAHVGYYLIGDGRPQLERRVGYKPSLARRLLTSVEHHPSRIYFGSLGVLTAGVIALTLREVSNVSWSVPMLVALGLLALLPASEIALSLTHAWITALLPPRLLPRLDLDDGVPDDLRTLVVVPCLLDSRATLDELLEDLEVRSLANDEDNVYFALLTDYADANVVESEQDTALLESAKAGITALNERYPRQPNRYWLLHRRRCFSPNQGRFIGWERKRGKLEELNRLLRGDKDTSFSCVLAPTELFASVRYVITLDADTELPRDTARELIATIGHPLNQARFDEQKQRVVEGYGIVQPRVGALPLSSRRSRYAVVSAGPSGIDPYTTAVSDVYQDLFREGSYTGKGIYDVDAFNAAMHGRAPQDALLSHDLFESFFVRSALASDIELLDEQPSAYEVHAGRQHRWIRGDWQLIGWLLPRVRWRDGHKRRNDLRLLDRWKLFDNLRRSLVPAALVALCAFGWFAGGVFPLAVTVLLGAFLLAPVVARVVLSLARKPSRSTSRFLGLGGDLARDAANLAVNLSTILDQALLAVDAISLALYRLFWSRELLLEWTAMRQSAATLRLWPSRRMLFGAALSLAVLAGLGAVQPASMPFAVPVLTVWTFAPLIAQWLSRPLVVKRANQQLRRADKRLLRLIARKTWRFFDQLVVEDDNHLPPDNFQEEPRGVVAHRTSPTNIGLYMLSTLAANDLGFIPVREMLRRLGLTLDTLDVLPRRDGHLLNWYDTQTLKPLAPEYVSTVDSGNLAGYLWTLSAACGELRRSPIANTESWRAIADALHLAHRRDEHKGKLKAPFSEQLHELERRITKRRQSTDTGLLAYWSELSRTIEAIQALRQDPVLLPEATRYWLAESEKTALAWHQQLAGLAPFLSLFANTTPSEPHLASAWSSWRLQLDQVTNAEQLRDAISNTMARVKVWIASQDAPSTHEESGVTRLPLALLKDLQRGLDATNQLLTQLDAVAARCNNLADGMNFSFLFDPNRELFVTGYNVTSARLDSSYYDLLASEARLASLIAVAKGDVPREHWFRLGRPRARVTSGRSLLSWSGSMFEYLMPLLVTRCSTQTLIGETMRAAVNRQRSYGAEKGVPWGISESAYNVMDLEMTYQYRAFGVPGLGLKAGLAEDLVVAPYATVLASLVEPAAAVKNLRALSKEGASGQFGYYEAIDYSPSRLPPGKRGVVVKAFMAHHLGMSLVAIDNVLHDNPMVRRFHTDLRVKATELLLEERIPTAAPLLRVPDAAMVAPIEHAVDLDTRDHVYLKERGPVRAHLLGRPAMSSLTTTHGCGVLTWNGLDINRFREDTALDGGGVYAYVRSLTDHRVWSAGYQPTQSEPDSYEVAFSIDRVEIHRKDGPIETTTEIVPSPEHAAEVRRFTFTNRSKAACEIELTTYTELVLAARAADLAHRAFSGMFIETEALPERGALIAHRRKRSPKEPDMWVAQVLTPEDDRFSGFDFDTSRAEFIGRTGSTDRPAALGSSVKALGRHTGPVLDPVFALRRRAKLAPGDRTRIALTTLAADSREEVLRLVETYAAPQAIPRVLELAWADARVELRHLGITALQAHRFQRLLSSMLFPQPGLRATVEQSSLSTAGKSALWGRGISGDLPILALRLDHPDFAELCREVLLAQEHFRINGVGIDLLILNEEPGGYLTPQQDQALSLIRSVHAEGRMDQHGGIFLRRSDQIPEGERNLALAAARVVLYASRGSLSRQLKQAARNPQHSVAAIRRPSDDGGPGSAQRIPRPELMFDNGIGGFTADGREYWMEVGPSSRTPAPWCNVMANPRFGSVVTEAGSSFTWYGNSQRHRLTPWSNDAIGDTSGEVVYIRDDDTGDAWTATPRPHGGNVHYAVAHGQGYSRFEHERSGLTQELTVFVDATDPVRIQRLRIVNNGARARNLSIFGLVEWVLGNNRENSRTTVMTATEGRAIVATNPFSAFNTSVAFFTTTATVKSFTGDRDEFFGRPGSRQDPAGLHKVTLSGKVGPGLDPCAAVHSVVTLAPGETWEASFVLGQAVNREQLKALLARYEDPAQTERSFDQVKTFWDDLLSTITIQTPDHALNVLFNRWLPYQALSCRIWARSGFYQSSGAYGFRDQVQDVLCVLHSMPQVAREHLLRAAARQFVEGDVQHWWHPEAGDGVRTHCSDDMLWLPYAVVEYVRVTGDEAILNEQVTFLTERALAPGEDDLYSVPGNAAESATLYEHCARALEVALSFGPHGLPTIGAGDWNDGMSRIGHEGSGESVWLGWFLSKALRDFAPVAAARGETQRSEHWLAQAAQVTRAIEAHGWDGAWYRRAYFDDGTPIGTRSAAECRIDAIAQSWATIAGGGDPARAARALKESERLLLNRETGMMLLLTPPFAHSQPDPGYISSYPAGVRENGGQYTHGVLFTLRALAQSGDRERTSRLLDALNPILHGDTPAKVSRYKVEPYVVAADVYASPSHFGRGGWTWYTGAAGWFYRVVLEDILGIQRHADQLTFKPCVPPHWQSFEVTYRYGRSQLNISVDTSAQSGGVRLLVNDAPQRNLSLQLRDDGRTHTVRLELGQHQLRSSA